MCIRDSKDIVAATNGYQILIGEKFKHYRKFAHVILLHEVLHIGLLHIRRFKTAKFKQLLNIAADCKVNQYIEEIGLQLPKKAVTPQRLAKTLKLSLDELQNMSVEEIYNELLKIAVKTKIKLLYPDWDLRPELGDPMDDDLEDKLAEIFKRSIMAGQEAGTVPKGLEGLVTQVFRPKIDWRRLLRGSFREWIGTFTISTWAKLNRKLGEAWKGYRTLGKPRVWVLVDTSGSVSERCLRQFFGEIRSMSKECEVFYGCFDAKFYGWQKVGNTPVYKIKGCGGTIIKPALEALLSKLKRKDMVIVCSDGFIRDRSEHTTYELFERVSCYANKAIFLTSSIIPKLPQKWQILKLT